MCECSDVHFMSSRDAVGAQERNRRTGDDLEITPQAPVLEIVTIELDPLAPSDFRATVHLPQAGEAWPSRFVEGTIEPRALIKFGRDQGAYPDNAHVTPEHVPELR